MLLAMVGGASRSFKNQRRTVRLKGARFVLLHTYVYYNSAIVLMPGRYEAQFHACETGCWISRPIHSWFIRSAGNPVPLLDDTQKSRTLGVIVDSVIPECSGVLVLLRKTAIKVRVQ